MQSHMDVRPRRPIDAKLNGGRKGPTGAPIEREGWHVVSLTMEQRETSKGRAIEFHPPHPAMEAWHRRPIKDRASVVVEIESSTWDGCASIGMERRAAVRPEDQPPHIGPWCRSVARGKAQRWSPAKRDYVDHQCAPASCPAASNPNDQKRCKPRVELYGRLVWPDDPQLPELVIHLNSGSWGSAGSIEGVVQEMDDQWAAIVVQGTGRSDLAGQPMARVLAETGLQPYTIRGLRLRLTITIQRSNAKEYPVIKCSVVGGINDWLLEEAARLSESRAALDTARQIEAPEVRQIAETPRVSERPARAVRALAKLESRGVDRATAETWAGAPAEEWTDAHLDTIAAKLEAP